MLFYGCSNIICSFLLAERAIRFVLLYFVCVCVFQESRETWLGKLSIVQSCFVGWFTVHQTIRYPKRVDDVDDVERARALSRRGGLEQNIDLKMVPLKKRYHRHLP